MPVSGERPRRDRHRRSFRQRSPRTRRTERAHGTPSSVGWPARIVSPAQIPHKGREKLREAEEWTASCLMGWVPTRTWMQVTPDRRASPETRHV
jgi:hypothetical protein